MTDNEQPGYASRLMNERLQIKRIDQSEFDTMREEWNELLNQSASDSVFLRWEWMHTWWDIFKQKRRLLILTARSNGRLVGIAPFYIETAGLLRTRYLKLCSEELSPDYLDIIAEKGQETEVARDIVNYIIGCTGEWDVIALDNLLANSILLTDPSLFMDYSHTVRVTQTCPYIKIQGTFEHYYRTREGLVRFSLEKKHKKLIKEMKVNHAIVRDENGLATALDDLYLLHRKRAKEKGIQSNFLSPDVKRFHKEVGRLFLRDQILNLQFLYGDKNPISALYAFNYGNKTYYYQAGSDPEWGKWSVGGVLLYLTLQKAFNDGYDEFDLLKGAESYKSLWSNANREEMFLAVYNKNLRGSFWRALNNLRSVLRTIKTRATAP